MSAKIATTLVLLISINLVCYADPSFSSNELLSYLNKPYSLVKTMLLKKGYKPQDVVSGIYSFSKMKNGLKYECSIGVKRGRTNAISVQDHYSEYTAISEEIQSLGFSFEQGTLISPYGYAVRLNEALGDAIPSTIIKFNRSNENICNLVCPPGLKQSEELFTVVYGNYSK